MTSGKQPREGEQCRSPGRGSLKRVEPGCLMWIIILVILGGPLVLSSIAESTTGFHLRQVKWIDGPVAIMLAIVWFGGGLALTTRTVEYLTGEKESRISERSDGDHLDRGAGTMSWHDSDGGSE